MGPGGGGGCQSPSRGSLSGSSAVPEVSSSWADSASASSRARMVAIRRCSEVDVR